MNIIKQLDFVEYEREWRPLADRLFKRGVDWDESSFNDPSWRSVPMPCTPFYSPCHAPGLPRPPDFPPIEPYFQGYYEPLYLTMAEFGIDHMVVEVAARIKPAGQKSFVPKFPWAYVMPPSVAAADAVVNSDDYVGILPTSLFSRDGTWGMVTDGDELAELAGTPEFIEIFYRNSGGERAARARYSYFLLSNSCFGFDDLFTQGFYHQRWPLVHMYQRAGWPLPNRWYLWDDEELDWSWMMDDEGFPPASLKGKPCR